MNDRIKILAAASTTFAILILLPGCGESSESNSAETHTADDGHDHAGDGHDHGGHDHGEGEHDDHTHGDMRSLGSVTIAGITLAVSVSGNIAPSSVMHLDLEVESGPIPAAVRFWIGDEAGMGALKSKADAHDNHFHGQTESPSTMDGASLWIEIESVNGNRTVGSMPLEG